MRRLRLGLVCLLLSPMSHTAFAECVADPGHQLDSDTRVREFFINCQRKPNQQERRLYTWGHQEKLSLLQRYPYSEFSLYNVAQQDAYAGAQARKSITEVTSNEVVFRKFIRDLRSVYGTANVTQLLAYNRDPEHLANVQNLWRRSSATRLRPFRLYTAPLLADDEIDFGTLVSQTREARTGFKILALEQAIPGFIDRLDDSVSDRMDLLQRYISEAEKNDTPLAPLSLVRGELLGLQRSFYQDKPSNISFGPAVYFGSSPSHYVDHFKNSEHAGLVCQLDSKAKIADISSSAAQKTMLDYGLYLRDPNGARSNYPSGYNEVSNPRHLRQAAMGLLIRNGRVYSDNGVINYRACKKIRLGHFKACSSISTLLRQANFVNEQASLRDYFSKLAGESSNKIFDRFMNRIENCARTQSRKDTEVPVGQQICARIQDRGFLSSYYFTNNRTRLEKINAEHCSN